MKVRLLSFLASSYIRFVGWTSRIVWVNRSVRDEVEASGKGFIYAFWHGRQVFLTYLHRGDGTHILISKSVDGEIIARVCQSFGLPSIRGSSSRGGTAALLKLHDLIKSGQPIGITPDGPRGPLHEVQPGVLHVAQSSGCPIIPVVFGARRKWVFNKSWDEFIVPKPFNRIAVMYGEPIFVGPHDALALKAAELKQALNFTAHEVDVISQGECSEMGPAAPEKPGETMEV